MKKFLFMLGAFVACSVATAQETTTSATTRTKDGKTEVQATSTDNTARTHQSANSGTQDDTRLEGSSPKTTSDIVAPEGSLNSRVAPGGNTSDVNMKTNSGTTTTETTTSGTMSKSDKKKKNESKKMKESGTNNSGNEQ